MALEKRCNDGGEFIAVQIFKTDSAAGDIYIYFGEDELIETEAIANEIADFIIKRLQSDKPLVVLTQDELVQKIKDTQDAAYEKCNVIRTYSGRATDNPNYNDPPIIQADLNEGWR